MERLICLMSVGNSHYIILHQIFKTKKKIQLLNPSRDVNYYKTLEIHLISFILNNEVSQNLGILTKTN